MSPGEVHSGKALPGKELTGETVVLLHGVLLGSWTLRLIARRLRRQGYRTNFFSYPSRRRSLDENARALAHYIDGLDAEMVHLVGHSLGGLVILRALQISDGLPGGKVVLLGAPVNGSVIAARLNRIAIGRWLLSKSLRSALLDGIAITAKRPTGLIVGHRPFGIGMLLGGLSGPHDGTVSVSETVLESATDTLLLQETHSSLLLSAVVAGEIAGFLRDSRFEHGQVAGASG